MPKVAPVAAPAQNMMIKATTQPRSQADHTPQPKGPEDMVKTGDTAAAPQAQTGQPNLAKTEATPNAANTADPRLEAQAKKEIALRTLERDLKTQQANIKSQIDEAVKTAIAAERAKFKSNPLDELEADGVTYDTLVEQAVNRPDPEIRKLSREIQTLKTSQDSLAKQAQTAQQVAREKAIVQLKSQIEKMVDTDAEFETIKTADAVQDVVDYMVKTFDETGELPDTAEATRKIENDLFAEAMKFTGLKKVQEKLKPSLADAVAAKQGEPSSGATTLTNSMTSDTTKLSARERAILAFEGKLKR